MKRFTVLLFAFLILLSGTLTAQEPSNSPTFIEHLTITTPVIDAQGSAFHVDGLMWSADGTQLTIRYLQFNRSTQNRITLEGFERHVWDIDRGILIDKLNDRFDSSHPVAWNARGDYLVAWNKDGTRAAVYSSDGELQIWEVNSEEPSCVLPIEDSFQLAWSNEDNLLATESRSSWLDLWDTELCQKHLDFENQKLLGISWNPTTNTFVARNLGGRDELQTIKIFDASTGEILLELPNPAGEGRFYLTPLWSADEKYLLSNYSGGLSPSILWDMASGEVSNLTAPVILDADWHPHQNWLALISSSAWEVVIWDVDNQIAVYNRAYPDEALLQFITWSPDGKWLALASSFGPVHIWKLEN